MVDFMREKKNHLYVDSGERSILLHSLVELKKGLELLLRSVSKVKRQINPHLRIDGILAPLWIPPQEKAICSPSSGIAYRLFLS